MSIKIKISSAHQYVTDGVEIVEVEGNTVAQCLKDLIRKFPSLEKFMYNDADVVSNYLLVFLNGENIPHTELDKAVKNDDEISLVMLIDGG
jgi:molybdopterin converting factor small subunit